MNSVFAKLLQNKSAMRPFIQWYDAQYPNALAVFQTLPFNHQLGVYLTYFETIYNLIIIVNTHGYSIQFSDNRLTPIYGKNNMQYNHYKYDYTEPKSILFGYELGIMWLFENFDVPF